MRKTKAVLLLCFSFWGSLLICQCINSSSHGLLMFILANVLLLASFTSAYYAATGKMFLLGINTSNIVIQFKKIILSVAVVLFYAPICFNGFFFHDDYINFTGTFGGIGFFELTIGQGRPVTGLLTDLMSYVTVENSWHLRIFAVVAVVIYALLLFQLFQNMSMSANKALCISFLLSVVSPVIDIVAYGSMFCYPLAFVFSSYGVICLYEAVQLREFNRRYFLLLCLCVFYVIISNLIYQAAATVAFSVIFIIYLYENRDEFRFFPIFATIIFVIATGIYYLLVKLITLSVGTTIMGRASVVSTVEEICSKIDWFCTVVIPQNIKLLASTVIGNKAFTTPWQHYLLEFINPVVENVWIWLIAALLVVALINIGKKYGLAGVVQVIALCPLSYYVFLVLTESTYLSFYSVALNSVLFIAALYAVNCVVSYIHIGRLSTVALYIIVIIAVINGNYYMNNFWIGENGSRYQHLKQSIALNYNGEERIHVIGVLHPNEADVYASNAAKIACKELGIDIKKIEFTSSNEPDLVNPISLEVYTYVLDELPEEKKQQFISFYSIDKNFSLCYLNTDVMDELNYDVLKDMFIETKVIPSKDSSSVLVIDIRDEK